MPISPSDFFKTNAGKIDMEDPQSSLVPYMSVGGEEEYQTTFLDSYSYTCKEHPSGISEYALTMDWEKNGNPIYSYMSIDLSAKIDTAANNELTSLEFSLRGYPDQISTDDWEANYPKLLSEVKEQLKLVFGDGIDVSDLTLDKFETTSTDTNGVEIKECFVPVKLTVLDKEFESVVKITLSDTAVDTLRALWEVTVVFNP